MPVITSQWPGKCAACGKPYAEGASIYYDRKGTRGKKCYHVDCMPGKPAPAPEQPPLPQEPAPDERAAERSTFERIGLADVHRFDDIGALVAASMKPSAANRHQWERFQSSAYGTGRHWYGVETLADVRRIVEAQQWPEGAAKLLQKLGDIGATMTPRSVRRVRRWADNGDHVEMTRVWAGRVDVAWTRCYREQRTGPQRVRIVADVGINCNTDSEVAFWRGAAAVRLADLLTTSGYNVQIDVAHFTRQHGENNGRHHASFVTVKPYIAPLDVIALASTACLPGFLRHYLFQHQDCAPYRVRDNHGEAVPQEKIMPREPDAVMVDHSISNADTARAWINAKLAEIQGELAIAA